MISLKKNFLRLLIGLVIIDILVLICLLGWEYYSFGMFFLPQILYSFINYNYDKGRLFEHIKSERNEVLIKYSIWGKYTNWELKILKVARENNDIFLRRAGRIAMWLNVVPCFVVLNIIMFLFALEKFNF